MEYMSVDEIVKVAIQIEERGKEFYSLALERATDDGVQSHLRMLINWEAGHVLQMEDLRKTLVQDVADESMESPFGEDSSLYIKAIAEGHVFIKNSNIADLAASCKTVKDLLLLARDFERDSVMFYEALLGVVRCEESKKAVQEILNEEKNHVVYIQKMIGE